MIASKGDTDIADLSYSLIKQTSYLELATHLVILRLKVLMQISLDLLRLVTFMREGGAHLSTIKGEFVCRSSPRAPPIEGSSHHSLFFLPTATPPSLVSADSSAIINKSIINKKLSPADSLPYTTNQSIYLHLSTLHYLKKT